MRAPAAGVLLAPRRRPRVTEEHDVASASRPGVVHTVRRRADGSWECGCEDFTYRAGPAGEECKHILEVR